MKDILLFINPMIWKDHLVSERIEPGGGNVNKNQIDDLFIGGNVIDSTYVTVGDICKYECSKECRTNLEYWHSKKTVNLYENYLFNYNVKLSN
ncbi:TPA: hypothetical protein R8F93_003319 [Enterobacter soli]|uniref:Uncharacterized protein n=1 Tax=Enterobacter soli TaxID=885040 RepID=A0AAW8H962_9ENTR|nr:hypothetical protein [Enterobacter soli]MDQ2256485.1 hypothetical protein [Enterobacter soli]MDQ2335700.1 hypothetical protein [Enterobacter soli]HEE9789254.1 hypothetical protein [Enterobacter soli]